MALYNKHTVRPDSYRGFSYPNFVDIRALNTTFESVMAHDLSMVGLTEGDVTRRMFAEFATHDYAETFGVEPFDGRFFTAEEETPGAGVPVALVGYSHWQENGSDADMVGSQVTVNGHDLTVIGIMPQYFTGRTALLSPGIYLPFGMHHLLMNDMFIDQDAGGLAERGNHRIFIVGRLRDGVSMEEADAQLDQAEAGARGRHVRFGDHQKPDSRVWYWSAPSPREPVHSRRTRTGRIT